MTQDELKNVRARTDAKLKYAELHLAHLAKYGGNGGTDLDRAFQESFLFHLLGVLDAFLIELNAYYASNLPTTSLSRGKLRNELKRRGSISAELAELHTLEADQTSWLFHAKEMRDHSTHMGGVPRAFHVGGPHDGKVFLRNPLTMDHVEIHVMEALEDWLKNMHMLVDRLRASAIAANTI